MSTDSEVKRRNPDIPPPVADRLKRAREDTGVTQGQLGQAIGVSAVQISKWETGTNQPSIGAIVQLADVLGVTADYLLGRSAQKRPSVVSEAWRALRDIEDRIRAAYEREKSEYLRVRREMEESAREQREKIEVLISEERAAEDALRRLRELRAVAEAREEREEAGLYLSEEMAAEEELIRTREAVREALAATASEASTPPARPVQSAGPTPLAAEDANQLAEKVSDEAVEEERAARERGRKRKGA